MRLKIEGISPLLSTMMYIPNLGYRSRTLNIINLCFIVMFSIKSRSRNKSNK